MSGDFSQVCGFWVLWVFMARLASLQQCIRPSRGSRCQACCRQLDCIRLASLEQHRRIHFTVQRDLVAQATGRELRERF